MDNFVNDAIILYQSIRRAQMLANQDILQVHLAELRQRMNLKQSKIPAFSQIGKPERYETLLKLCVGFDRLPRRRLEFSILQEVFHQFQCLLLMVYFTVAEGEYDKIIRFTALNGGDFHSPVAVIR